MKELITHNWKIKLGSILLATLLWLFVMGQEVYEVQYRVPISIDNVPDQLEVVEQSATAVSVSVLGQPRVVRSITAQDIDPNLSLSADAGAGETVFEIPPERIQVPRGVRVIRVSPSRVSVRLEPLEERFIKVHPRIVGRPAVGFQLGEISVQPQLVRVRGAKSAMETLEEVNSEPIDISEAKNSFTQRVTVRPFREHVYVQDPVTVIVQIEILEKELERSFSGLTVRCVSPSADLEATCSPESVDVTIRGPYTIVSELQGTGLDVSASSREIATADSEARVEPQIVGLPRGVSVVQIEPTEVEMRLVRKEATESDTNT